MKKSNLLGLAMLALSTAVLPSVVSAGFYTNFSLLSLLGPYQFHQDGSYVDSNGNEGHLSLSGLLLFDGTGGVTAATATGGLQLSAAENGSDLSGSPFFINCIATVTAGTYSVNTDGTGELNLTFGNSGTAPCFGATLPGTFSFSLALSEETTHGAANLALLSDQPRGWNFHGGTDTISSLSLTGALVHQ